MKAAVLSRYGGPEVIVLRERDKPTVSGNEILIRTIATSVTQVDSIFRSGRKPFARMATGIFKPKIPVLGTELSGIVEETGDEVSVLKPGDEVIADSGTFYGAHAEWVKLSDKDPVVIKPAGMTFTEAAALSYGGITALSFLRDTAELQKGQRILILGASGSVGSYAVQIAKELDAQVTGVCGSSNVELVRELGADEVINYHAKAPEELNQSWDVIFDCVGKYSYSGLKHLLEEQGIFMTTDLSTGILKDQFFTSLFGKKKAFISLTGIRNTDDKRKDLLELIGMYEKGAVKPLVDRVYDLADISEAHAYVHSGRKKGNVVIKIGEVADE